MDRISLPQLLEATHGQAVGFGAAQAEFGAVGIDSRLVRAGDVFWAIRGARRDGHDFTDDARRRGAAACVISRARAGQAGVPSVIVDDTLVALGQFARWYRRRQDALIIGVTGSVGKTTTREMIHAALSIRFHGVRSPQNFNNHVGLPLSLLAVEHDHEFAVLEFGASGPGEIRELAAIAEPEVGVVTNIGAAHLEGFGDERGVLKAKGELVDALPASGFVVLPGDDATTPALAALARCRVIRVGERSDHEFCATAVSVDARQISFRVDGGLYVLPVTGRHHVRAALFAIAIGREVGLSHAELAEGLACFKPAPGRCQTHRIGPWTVIDDSYNANPLSMRAACELLRDWTGFERRLLVAGDMLELGSQAAAFHYSLGAAAAEAAIDHLIVYGRHAADVGAGARAAGLDSYRIAECENFEAVLAVLDCWLDDGDVVLIKGSRGMRMERIVDWLHERAKENSPERKPGRRASVCASV